MYMYMNGQQIAKMTGGTYIQDLRYTCIKKCSKVLVTCRHTCIYTIIKTSVSPINLNIQSRLERLLDTMYHTMTYLHVHAENRSEDDSKINVDSVTLTSIIHVLAQLVYFSAYKYISLLIIMIKINCQKNMVYMYMQISTLLAMYPMRA